MKQPAPARKSRLRLSSTYHSHIKSFSRANATALAATVSDFSTLYLLVEHFHLYYVAATACGAVAGAITNFLLNRFWAFDSRHQSVHSQGVRYGIVSAGSLALNTGLVFLLTDYGGLMYLKSKVIAALAVGWLWNYPLHRYFVFPPKPNAR